MKRRFSSLLRKLSLPAMILAGAMVLVAPATVLARGPAGGHGGGRSYSGGGQHFSSPAPAFRGGGGYYRGGDRYYRGGYAPGFRYHSAPYYGYGYSYAPNPCNPAGYYDSWGRWIPYAGCYVPPTYGY